MQRRVIFLGMHCMMIGMNLGFFGFGKLAYLLIANDLLQFGQPNAEITSQTATKMMEGFTNEKLLKKMTRFSVYLHYFLIFMLVMGQSVSVHQKFTRCFRCWWCRRSFCSFGSFSWFGWCGRGSTTIKDQIFNQRFHERPDIKLLGPQLLHYLQYFFIQFHFFDVVFIFTNIKEIPSGYSVVCQCNEFLGFSRSSGSETQSVISREEHSLHHSNRVVE